MGKKEIKGIKKFLIKLKKDFGVSRVVFFGSRANGNPKKYSDIDLIIVSDDFKNMNFFERVSKMYDYWDLDYPVDFLCYTNKEFDILKIKISIVKEALKHGILI